MVTSRLWVMSFASGIGLICWTQNGFSQQKPIPPGKTTDSMALPELRARPKRPVTPPPAVTASPSIEQLLEIVRRQPGGAQLLERARRTGAKIPSVGSNADDAFRTVATGSGPRSSEAFDAVSLADRALPPISATVNRPNPKITVAGVGTLQAEGIYPLYATYDKVWGPLDRVWYGASPAGGSFDARSWVSIVLTAQTTGWYLVNVQATPIAAELRMRSASGSSYDVIHSFGFPTTYPYSSYPVLLYLGAGYHAFSWVNRDFFAYVSEVSATKF